MLIWPDAFRLRPSMRAIAGRIASGGGGSVQFWCQITATACPKLRSRMPPPSTFRMRTIWQLRPLMASVNAAGNAKDATAYVGFLDAQRKVNKAKIGTQGYCMGGALVVRTAASLPDRIGGRIIPRRRPGDGQT